jgi:hypothetical protein
VLVKKITNQLDSQGEEDDAKIIEAVPYVIGKKIKAQDATYITLPYLLYAFVTVDDMLRKVPKLRYSDHDVRDVTKFPYLEEEDYLESTMEIGPLGKPIMEPV